ncbi:22836_t:CDS:2, partial [Cetraspora pellucida]
MNCFDCHRKLTLKVDILASKIIVKLRHDIIHERPVNVTTPMKIKQAIIMNLYLNPIQLRTYLRNKFDTSKITMQQIHYWWSLFSQNFYKSDKNYIISAHNFLLSGHASGCELCFELINRQITAIGFTTPLLNAKNNQYVTEVYCDVTYKTAKGRFELYRLIGNFEGSGYLLAYLILDTTGVSESNSQNENRTSAYHYQVEDVIAEFDFIDPKFKPNLENYKPESYEICSQNLRQHILNLVKKHFNLHPKISVNADENYKTDLPNWVCSCPSFLNSCLLICKHLIHNAIEHAKTYDSEGVCLVYSNFKRCTDYSFLIWDGNSNRIQDSPFNTCMDANTKSSTQENMLRNNFYVKNVNDENIDPELRQY